MRGEGGEGDALKKGVGEGADARYEVGILLGWLIGIDNGIWLGKRFGWKVGNIEGLFIG